MTFEKGQQSRAKRSERHSEQEQEPADGEEELNLVDGEGWVLAAWSRGVV